MLRDMTSTDRGCIKFDDPRDTWIHGPGAQIGIVGEFNMVTLDGRSVLVYDTFSEPWVATDYKRFDDPADALDLATRIVDAPLVIARDVIRDEMTKSGSTTYEMGDK